jgi:hypothetical protein
MSATEDLDSTDFLIRTDVGDLLSRIDGVYTEYTVIGQPSWLSIIFSPDQNVGYMAVASGNVLRNQIPDED